MAKPPSNKILLMLPFWDGDKAQCMELARLLADMRVTHSDNADILFVARFDAKHDKDTVAYVKRRFDVLTHTSRRSITGWPMGCNGLFYGTIEYATRMSGAGRIPNYKAFFNCAADTCPLTRDAVDYLHWGFEKNRAASIMGALVNHGGREHINGDAALFANNQPFLENLIRQLTSLKLTAGWDWALNEEFRRAGWANFPGIESYWQTPTIDSGRLGIIQKKGVHWLHGIKDTSCLRHIRQCLLGG